MTTIDLESNNFFLRRMWLRCAIPHKDIEKAKTRFTKHLNETQLTDEKLEFKFGLKFDNAIRDYISFQWSETLSCDNCERIDPFRMQMCLQCEKAFFCSETCKRECFAHTKWCTPDKLALEEEYPERNIIIFLVEGNRLETLFCKELDSHEAEKAFENISYCATCCKSIGQAGITLNNTKVPDLRFCDIKCRKRFTKSRSTKNLLIFYISEAYLWKIVTNETI